MANEGYADLAENQNPLTAAVVKDKFSAGSCIQTLHWKFSQSPTGGEGKHQSFSLQVETGV